MTEGIIIALIGIASSVIPICLKSFFDYKRGRDTLPKDVEDLKQLLKMHMKEEEEHNRQMNEHNKQMQDITISQLRHSITNIYHTNKKSEKLEDRMKEDLCSLYTSYTSLGGNSYVHEIYDEMMNWESK